MLRQRVPKTGRRFAFSLSWLGAGEIVLILHSNKRNGVLTKCGTARVADSYTRMKAIEMQKMYCGGGEGRGGARLGLLRIARSRGRAWERNGSDPHCVRAVFSPAGRPPHDMQSRSLCHDLVAARTRARFGTTLALPAGRLQESLSCKSALRVRKGEDLGP